MIAIVALGVGLAVLVKQPLGESRRNNFILDSSKIATRIPAGRVGSINNMTSKTYQATYELVGSFDAVRVIFGSDDEENSVKVTEAIVSAPSSADDLNNSNGAWSRVTSQGETEFSISSAPHENGQTAYTVSDWLPLTSVDRTDGAGFPLVSVRARMAPTSALPVLGNGKDDFTNWASRSDGGRKFWWREQEGDHVSDPSGFASSVNRSQSPIFGIQYLCSGRVVTVAAVGDSITEGRGSYIGEGFILPLLEKLNSDSNSTKYEYANFGWSGQNPAQYTERALRLLDSELKPDVLIFPAGSPNPASAGALTDEAVSKIAVGRDSVVAAAQDQGVVPLIWTWLPTNATVRSYGTTDARRVAYNSELLQLAPNGLLVADVAEPLSGPVVGGQVQMAEGLSKDGIHPNDAGNAVIGVAVEPALITALRRSQQP
ncbi:SGNH/GDSL hydrolase family protein [Mycolicibacterium litorale]|uniref:SGNH/GDSL hydrolase family protein n=1 Tax=Mycolicibacterium litorale TaxID=758802 RepID=UPI0013D00880|nr:SGNH/GDSL hydrolase family protein [Mycolicibacterium litorale]MCV7416427.1 SGNH/GDSL hydrolase family protein [Mycolicibacterium litorale]